MGISDGGIVAIVVVCIALIAGIVVGGVILYRRKKQRKNEESQNTIDIQSGGYTYGFRSSSTRDMFDSGEHDYTI